MKCPNCHSDNTQVVDSRSDGNGTRGRKNHCNHCRRDFYTVVKFSEEVEKQVKGQHTVYSRLNAFHSTP